MAVGLEVLRLGRALQGHGQDFVHWLEVGYDEGEDSWMTSLGEWLGVMEVGNRRSGRGLGWRQNTEFWLGHVPTWGIKSTSQQRCPGSYKAIKNNFISIHLEIKMSGRDLEMGVWNSREKPCQGIWIWESPVYGCVLGPWEGGLLLGKDMRREEGQE